MTERHDELTPRAIVKELDRDIVGQGKAKRAVAIAIRNRIRRQRLDETLAIDVNPKNIVLIGPTGVGKTEIARRLARLMKAPFCKVEATKFTEVGYMGRDVESMIRDLTHNGIAQVKAEQSTLVEEEAKKRTVESLLDALVPDTRQMAGFELGALLGQVDGFEPGMEQAILEQMGEDGPFKVDGALGNEGSFNDEEGKGKSSTPSPEEIAKAAAEKRKHFHALLIDGKLENEEIEVSVQESAAPSMEMVALGPGSEEMEIQFRNVLKGIMPQRASRKRMKVCEARPILLKEHIESLLDMEKVIEEGIKRVEESGIVFLDEIDKVAMPTDRRGGSGPDVSREGVQRDLLPVVEGTTVITKFGAVKTNHILFIAAGAFHMSRPADLIPELQGRFPIRVELEDLDVSALRKILVEPRTSLTKQYRALLAADGLELDFSDDGLDTIAEMAYKVNQESENLGARRLHTVMEKLLEDLLFDAPDNLKHKRKVIDGAFVRTKLAPLVGNRDLSRFIL